MEKPSTDLVEHADDQHLGHLANQEDHELGKWQSLKKYPWTFAWCVYAVWCVLLVSFENQASGNVTGIPEFRKDFGNFYDGDWVLDAKWQSAFSGGPVASAVVGALCSGQIADAIGRKLTIGVSLLITVAAVTLEFVATTNEMFFGGKFLNGFALGALASVPITYVGEVCFFQDSFFSYDMSFVVILTISIDHPPRPPRDPHLPHSSGILYWPFRRRPDNKHNWNLYKPLGLPCRVCSSVRLRRTSTRLHSIHARVTLVAGVQEPRRQSPQQSPQAGLQ